MDTSLSGAAVIVTGAGAGIGKGCALALAEAGAAVAVTDMNEGGIEETIQQIVAEGGHAVGYVLDVRDAEQWADVVAKVEADLGPVGGLVNNAGVRSVLTDDRGLVDLDLSTWDLMISTHLTGTMLGTRTVLPGMIAAGGGSIVNISSIGSEHSVRGVGTAYVAAKSGINGLTRGIAATYGVDGIRCNGVAPGVIVVSGGDEAQSDFVESRSRLTHRAGEPVDIANTVVFLLSSSSSYVNGQLLNVDGGLSIHMAGLSGLTVPPAGR